MARALLKPAEELTLEDVRSFANLYAYDGPVWYRNSTKPAMSIGYSVIEFLRLWMAEDPLCSKCAPRFATCVQTRADGLRCLHDAAG